MTFIRFVEPDSFTTTWGIARLLGTLQMRWWMAGVRNKCFPVCSQEWRTGRTSRHRVARITDNVDLSWLLTPADPLITSSGALITGHHNKSNNRSPPHFDRKWAVSYRGGWLPQLAYSHRVHPVGTLFRNVRTAWLKDTTWWWKGAYSDKGLDSRKGCN